MSIEKELKAIHQQKHDIEENWLKATSFKPRAGQLIVYDVDDTHSTPRIKIGDGKTNVNDLPFATEKVAIYNGDGENAIQQELRSDTFTLVNEYVNSNTEVQKADNGEIIAGALGFHAASFNGRSQALGKGAFAEGVETVALGKYSHAQGNATFAAGGNAHSEGLLTSAIGESSHAEGNSSRTEGEAAHAEGYYTKATGAAAHSEGFRTSATKSSSHAEGSNTKATADSAHAEGGNTNANGLRSHAEGVTTKAIGVNSHAEGDRTEAHGASSHSEGINTKALKDYSHAEGSDTEADGISAHAEGVKSKAAGDYSHAEGNNTKASGEAAHSEGFETEAFQWAHAEGYSTKAYGKGHAEGMHTEARGEAAHAEGTHTYAATFAHAEGGSTRATGLASHSEGSQTLASGTSSHAGGEGTIASAQAQTAIGRWNSPKENTLFEVGNGGTPEKRQNAFEVYQDGHAELQTQGTTDNSIVTLKKLTSEENLTLSANNKIELSGGSAHGGSISVSDNGAHVSSFYSVLLNTYTTSLTVGDDTVKMCTDTLELGSYSGENSLCTISNVAIPKNDNEAANKKYVDEAVANAASGDIDISGKQDKFADVDKDANTVSLIPSGMGTKDYNITLLGRASGSFISGIVNALNDNGGNDYTIYIEQGGFTFNYNGSNGALELTEGTEFTLSKPANSTGPAILSIPAEATSVRIKNVNRPVDDNDATNKTYVDTKISGKQNKFADVTISENAGVTQYNLTTKGNISIVGANDGQGNSGNSQDPYTGKIEIISNIYDTPSYTSGVRIGVDDVRPNRDGDFSYVFSRLGLFSNSGSPASRLEIDGNNFTQLTSNYKGIFIGSELYSKMMDTNNSAILVEDDSIGLNTTNVILGQPYYLGNENGMGANPEGNISRVDTISGRKPQLLSDTTESSDYYFGAVSIGHNSNPFHIGTEGISRTGEYRFNATDDSVYITRSFQGRFGVYNTVDVSNLGENEIAIDTTNNKTYIKSKELILNKRTTSEDSSTELLVSSGNGTVRYTNLATPVNPTDAVNKQYVDDLIAALIPQLTEQIKAQLAEEYNH